MQFHQHQLANGLQIIAETNPRVHSVAAGFFVKAGARDETAEVSGVSHFLEHMAFKGDARYTADDINRIFDEVGARYNASTSEEVTLFYAAVLPEYLPQTFEILATLIYPSLREEDFEVEKQVILEEIGMYEDSPSFSTYDLSMSTHFAGHPLGQSILGSTQSITDLTSEQMRTYHAQHYRAGNITLAVAGRIEMDEVIQLAEKWCKDWPAGSSDRNAAEPAPTPRTELITRPQYHQQHLMQLGAAPSAKSPLRYAAEVLSVLVGDDSGSRLYWDLVDPGDAESAELGYNEYDGCGCWSLYLCCNPDDVAENLERIETIFADISAAGFTEEELEQAKNKVASRIVLSSERPMGRLSSLGSNWVYRKEYCTVNDDLDALQAISTDALRELLAAYPLKPTTTVGVGPLSELSETGATHV